MKRNILALYIIKLSKWFTLVMPIIVLFYEDHGLGLQDVFILKSVYSIAAVALEIPSGYLADVWGRRKCLILGCILFFLGYLCYSFTSTFAAFVIAEILLGTGQTLVNGADSALLYDTTVQYKKENLYLRYEGRITMIGNFAEAIAGIFGGLLAAYSLRYPFYAQALIAFSGIPAAFALQELNIKSKVQSPVQEIVRIIRYSLVTNKRLCYNIMFSGIIGAATLTMAWFVQPYLMYMNTPTSWFGVIWTVLNLTVGIRRSLFGPCGQLFRSQKDGHSDPDIRGRRLRGTRLQPDLRRASHPVRFLYHKRLCHPDIKRIHQPDDLFGDACHRPFHP